MAVLRALVFILPLLSASAAMAGLWDFFSRKPSIVESVTEGSCLSAGEYRDVVEFLRNEKESPLHDRDVRRVAEKVSRGCTGAAKRFKSVYRLLAKTGVDLTFSANAGAEMSLASQEQVRAFIEVFKKAYLENGLNLDYSTAYRLAAEFSRLTETSPSIVASDFSRTVDYCLSPDQLSMSPKDCLPLAREVAARSRYFPQGVFPAFERVYRQLREDQRFGLSVGAALPVALKITSHGPLGEKNFLEAFEYALSDKGLNETAEQALSHALRMAERSHRGDEPPVTK